MMPGGVSGGQGQGWVLFGNVLKVTVLDAAEARRCVTCEGVAPGAWVRAVFWYFLEGCVSDQGCPIGCGLLAHFAQAFPYGDHLLNGG